tara:strand:+ start:494 stop:2473 length:1980 start_codon:yes stop_codon:yes gene_type:complete
MAKDVKFNITAVDKTKNAFKSVLGGLKKVSGALLNFKTAIAGAVGVAGLGLLIKRSLEATDRIGKLSSVLGFSVKELQTFKLASQIGGVELETFSKGVRRLVDNFGDFMDGTGEAKKTFEALGISVEEANKLSGDQFAILGLVADRLNLVTNSTDKLKFAIEIFGGRGAELINVLKGGSEQIEEFRKQSEQFGALNEQQVKQVEDLNDSIVRLKTSFANITNQIVANLSPALTGMIDDFNESLTTTETGESRISEVAKSISISIIEAVKNSLIALNDLSKGIENTFLKIRIFAKDPIFSFTKDIQSFQDLEKEFDSQLQNLLDLESAYGHLDGALFNFNDAQNKGYVELLKVREQVKELSDFLVELRDQGYGKLNETTEKSISFLTKFLGIVEETEFGIKNTGEETTKTKNNLEELNETINDTNQVCTELTDNLQLVFQDEKVVEFQKKVSDLKVGGFDLLISTTEQLSGMFAKVFTDAIFRAKSLKEGLQELARNVIMQLVQGLIQIGLQVFVFDPLLKKIRSVADEEKKVNQQLREQIALRLILMAIGGGFGGGRANGGDVEGSRAFGGYVQGSRPMGGATGYGKAYMVGERGAELFVPKEDGTIIPNDKLGTTNNINITVMANDTDGFDDLLIKRRSTIINVINDALNYQGKEALV